MAVFIFFYFLVPNSPVIGSWNNCISGGEYVKFTNANNKITKITIAKGLLHAFFAIIRL